MDKDSVEITENKSMLKIVTDQLKLVLEPEEIDQIRRLLACKKCKNEFDVPKILPCGENICIGCLREVTESFRSWDITQRHLQFDCPICDNKHNLPKLGEFDTNYTLIKIQNILPRKNNRMRFLIKFSSFLIYLLSIFFLFFIINSICSVRNNKIIEVA